jgi:hypothetical protein
MKIDKDHELVKAVDEALANYKEHRTGKLDTRETQSVRDSVAYYLCKHFKSIPLERKETYED